MRRSLWSFLSVTFVVCLVLFTLFSLGLAPSRALAQEPATGPDDLLARVAWSAGRDPSTLVLGDQGTVTLADGSKLLRVSAVNPATGDTVLVTFDGDTPVDEAAVRARVAADWRAAHGAADYVLVRAMADLYPDDTLDVALWLSADVQPLPKQEHIYTPEPADMSTEGPLDTASEALPAGSFTMVDGKRVLVPIDLNQAPPDIAALLGAAVLAQAGASAASQPEPGAEKLLADYTSPVPDTLALVEEAQAQKELNDAYIREQIAPVRQHALDQLTSAGLTGRVAYASDTAPLIYLTGVTRREVEAMAFWPGVDTVYLSTNQSGPSLGIARPTQNANLLETYGGYTGAGVGVAVVEGGRMTTTNPYLSVTGVRNSAYAAQDHPTAVGGMIRSTHAGVRGLAPGVTLYSANGDDYATIAATEAAMDWAVSRSSVQNNSHWMDISEVDDSPQSPDRHLDYIARFSYDLPVVASGNFNTGGCQYGGSPAYNYVMSPAKGYNVLTVGNYDDHDTLAWTDDSMDPCSSYNHTNRWKPEVAATGHGISSTTMAAPWIAPRGSGTSYSAPMVTALAADLTQIAPTLLSHPEALKAIIMATALHNIEGSAVLSRQDGAGGIDASAAAVTAERGRWDARSINSGTAFPITFTVFARAGERVRFVTTWESNPTADYTTDPLPVNLDLIAFRADGTTAIGTGGNAVTNFEIVDFIAPAAENYLISVRRNGAWSGGSTWLGSAWYRGPHRISPDTGYSDPNAPPMGTHLAVRPADWLYPNYWRAFGVRSPLGTDHDLCLWSTSWFDDPSSRSQVACSTYVAGYTDFIVADGNHRDSSVVEQYRVSNYAGSGGYIVSRSDMGVGFVTPGLYGPFTMGAAEAMKVFDVYFYSGVARQISVVPGPANANNLGVALFKSNSLTATTWIQGRSGAVVAADASAAITATESLIYKNTGSGDWLGLVVHGRNDASAQFYVRVKDLIIYLPLVIRTF